MNESYTLTLVWIVRDFLHLYRDTRRDGRVPKAVHAFDHPSGKLLTYTPTNNPAATLPSVSITVDMSVLAGLCIEEARKFYIQPLVNQYVPDRERRNSRQNRIKQAWLGVGDLLGSYTRLRLTDPSMDTTR